MWSSEDDLACSRSLGGDTYLLTHLGWVRLDFSRFGHVDFSRFGHLDFSRFGHVDFSRFGHPRGSRANVGQATRSEGGFLANQASTVVAQVGIPSK